MNKKLFVALATCLTITLNLPAQLPAGSKILGGAASFGTNHLTYTASPSPAQNSNYGDFNVFAGRATRENTFIGFKLGYAFSNFNFDANPVDYNRLRAHNYSAGIFYTKYYLLAKDFYFSVEPALEGFFNSRIITYPGNDDKQDLKGYGVEAGITPGLSYHLVKKFYVQVTVPDLLSLQYMHSKETGHIPDNVQNSFYFSSSLQQRSPANALGLGFHFIL